MENLITSINKLFKDKKYYEIIDYLTSNSNSIWSREQVAKAYEDLKEYDKSIETYQALYKETNYYLYSMEIGRINTKLGNFSDRTKQYFLDAILSSEATDGKVLYNYFLFLFDSGQLTNNEMMKYYNISLFTDLLPSHNAWLASMLVEISEEELALPIVDKLYYNHRQSLSRFLNLLVFLEKRNYSMQEKEKKLISAYENIKNNQILFKETILKNNVSVVGNSPCEEGKGKGKDIDSAGLIARFNNYPEPNSQEFINDYGKLADIWMRSVGDWVEQRNSSNYKFIVVSGLNLLARSTNWKTFESYFSNNIPVVILPKEYEIELMKYLNSPPSAGISLLFYIYKVNGTLNKESAYGFSFTDQLKEDFVNIGGTIAGDRHEWHKEKELFEKMLNSTL